jgi:hypothetical protein
MQKIQNRKLSESQGKGSTLYHALSMSPQATGDNGSLELFSGFSNAPVSTSASIVFLYIR